jgi:tubulin-specific chaperone A
LYYIRRLRKEYELYQKELVDQKLKKDKLVADGAEEWDVKNAVSVHPSSHYQSAEPS